MKKSFFFAQVIVFLLASVGGAQTSDSVPSDPVVTGFVKVVEQVKLPAKEPGVLVHLSVKEGSQVCAGETIGQIDDREIQTQKTAAEWALRGAIQRWKDDVNIRYPKAAALVAKADYEELLETKNLVKKAVTDVDLRRAELEWKKMDLATEQAEHEQKLAMCEAYMKQAEFDAAKLAIERRLIKAPFDGKVEELSRKQEEWVNPGDTILRLFRMDTMQVEGAVDQTLYDPHELEGCEVTVEVQMARGRKETLQGRIVKVSSIIGIDGVYNVRAEVENRQEHGGWMLRDGMPAMMTVHLSTGGTAAAGVSRAP